MYTVSVIPIPSAVLQPILSGINNAGQVTGLGVELACTVALIGSPVGTTVVPHNDAGQIVGYFQYGAGEQGFIGTIAPSRAIRFFTWRARNNSTGNSGWQAVGSVTVP